MVKNPRISQQKLRIPNITTIVYNRTKQAKKQAQNKKRQKKSKKTFRTRILAKNFVDPLEEPCDALKASAEKKELQHLKTCERKDPVVEEPKEPNTGFTQKSSEPKTFKRRGPAGEEPKEPNTRFTQRSGEPKTCGRQGPAREMPKEPRTRPCKGPASRTEKVPY